MTQVAGVDGCSAGWLCIERSTDGSLIPTVCRSTKDLIECVTMLDLLTIDIPIGLPDDGPRFVDLLARRILGPRASSVFPTPVRAALDGVSYDDACERSFAACGKRLSKQAFAILPRIREIDHELRAQPWLQERVREVHPEVCFYYMNTEQPMAHPKKSGQGFVDRHRFIEGHFGTVFSPLRASVPRRDATDDDLLDSLVALWSAERLLNGTSITLPPDPPRDRFGLRMEMVA